MLENNNRKELRRKLNPPIVELDRKAAQFLQETTARGPFIRPKNRK